MKIFCLLSLVFCSLLQADLKKLCEEVRKWRPSQSGPEKNLYQGEMNWVPYAQVTPNIFNKDVILIDTRPEKDFKKGKLNHAVNVPSAALPKEVSDFETLTSFIKKISAQVPNSPTPSSFQNFTYYLYCNGEKCPRSALAACKLREWGVPGKNVNLVNEGYSEIH